jgi:hypothetical protein
VPLRRRNGRGKRRSSRERERCVADDVGSRFERPDGQTAGVRQSSRALETNSWRVVKAPAGFRHGRASDLCRYIQQSSVACAALGLGGCSQGFGRRILRRAGRYRPILIHSVSGGDDGFHPRGIFRAAHSQNAHALYAATNGTGRSDSKPNDDKLKVIGAEAGMHLRAMLPPGVSEVAISSRAAQIGISVIPLSSCSVKQRGRGGLILGYGGTDAWQIHDGIRRLA